MTSLLFHGVLLSLAAWTMGTQNGGTTASWPGVWGPTRNGTASMTGVPAHPSGFKELWRRKVQGGYSELSVVGRTVVTMEGRDGTDYVVALNADTGSERWRTAVGPTHRGHNGSHDGPIGTPTMDGRDVFATGPHGIVVALDVESGRQRWRHDLVKEFGASPPIYGFATSPLVEGEVVIVQTGGEKSRGLLAFDRATGKLLWNTPRGLRGGYSSPSIGVLTGTRQIVAAAGDHMFAVSPSEGRLLWSINGPGDGEAVANPPQLISADQVLFTTWTESVLVRITRSGDTFTPREVWRSPRLRASYSPAIHRDGHLYGFNGSFLQCLDAATGDLKWRHRFYEGTLIGVGNHLFVLGRSSGDLHVIEASPTAYKEVARTTVFTPGSTSLTGPSVAGNRVYLRNTEEMVALSIEGR